MVHWGGQSAGRTPAWAVRYSAGAEPSSQEEEGAAPPSGGMDRHGLEDARGIFRHCRRGYPVEDSRPLIFHPAGPRGHPAAFSTGGLGSEVWAGAGRPAGFRGIGFPQFGAGGQTNPLDSGAPADSAAIPAVLRRDGSIIVGKKFFPLYIWETKCMYSPQLKTVCVPTND